MDLQHLTTKIRTIVKQAKELKDKHTDQYNAPVNNVCIFCQNPDPTRPQQGDADFTVKDYQSFKEKYLKLPNFSLIKRPEFEMIELKDPDFDVLAYFSHPTLEELLGIKQES